MKATIQDMRALNYCSKGARAFAEKHNLDWKDFLKNGIEVSELEATGDLMALKIAEFVKNGRQR